jgi:hypothetical protein
MSSFDTLIKLDTLTGLQSTGSNRRNMDSEVRTHNASNYSISRERLQVI